MRGSAIALCADAGDAVPDEVTSGTADGPSNDDAAAAEVVSDEEEEEDDLLSTPAFLKQARRSHTALPLCSLPVTAFQLLLRRS